MTGKPIENFEQLTVEKARSLFFYDGSTGELRWRIASGCIKAGSLVKSKDSKGYLMVCVNKHHYKAHRIIWLMEKGSWPPGQIDHMNGMKSDNRLCNLRLATQKQNSANTGIRSSNKSGFKGVHYHRQSGKWQASICFDGKLQYLGLYDTALEASIVYARELNTKHGEFARIR